MRRPRVGCWRRAGHLAAALLLCWTWTGVIPGRVIDGDTFEAQVAIAPHHIWYPRVRVLGVDTPELDGATKPAALAAKAFTEAWLSRGPVVLVACKEDHFGRLLATVQRDGDNLATLLINAGHGVPR